MRKCFEQEEEDYHKAVRIVNFLVAIILSRKVMVIEIKLYQSINTFSKINHTSEISKIISKILIHRKFSQQKQLTLFVLKTLMITRTTFN